jgi:hypothetical protein
MAHPVTIVQPLSEVYGTPQWLRATTNVVGNSVSAAELDCTLAAEHAPELRRYCTENGIVWADFVAEHFRVKNVEFINHIERGVEVLRAAGRVGPIPTAEAEAVGRALVEQTAAAASRGAPKGNANAKRDENKGDHGNLCRRPEEARGNSSRHIVSRLKRDSASDPRAAAMLEAVGEGTVTPNAAAVELGWRKKKPTVTLDETPDRAAARLVERFGAEWCRDLVVALDAAVQRQGEGS